VFFDITIIKIIHTLLFNYGTNFLHTAEMLKEPQHTLRLMNFKRIRRLLLLNTTHAWRQAGLYCKFGLVINRKLARNIFFTEFTACDVPEGTPKHKDFHDNSNSPSYKHRPIFCLEQLQKSLAEV
jgi:hypothetical protein